MGEVHPGEGSGEGAPAGEAGGLHAVGSSGGRGAGGFWVWAGDGFDGFEAPKLSEALASIKYFR